MVQWRLSLRGALINFGSSDGAEAATGGGVKPGDWAGI